MASRTLADPLPWQNSTLLDGEASKAVAKLKRDVDGDFVVLGSGELVRSLLRDDLVDRFILLIHPLVLGSGSGSSTTAERLQPSSWRPHGPRRPACSWRRTAGRLTSVRRVGGGGGGCATHEGS